MRRLPAKYDLTAMSQSAEETNDPLIADHRSRSGPKMGSKVDRLLFAGSDLDKAREVFAAATYHRPRIRLTIQQRTHVLEQWPVDS